jgi:hypothetical protein
MFLKDIFHANMLQSILYRLSYVQCCVMHRVVDKFWVTGSLLNRMKLQKFWALTKGKLGQHWQSISWL